MNDNDKTLFHILSGQNEVEINDQKLVVKPPSYKDVYDSSILYDKVYNRAFLFGALSKDELLQYLLNRKLWSLEEENELEKLPEQLNNAKFDLYETYTRFGSIDNKRKVVKFINNRMNKLWSKKTYFDRFTVDGIASYHKTCFLICCGAHIDYNQCGYLDKLYYTYINSLYDDTKIRQVAKSDDWRNYWRAIKLGYKIFDNVLTKEQYSLIAWSQFYDNIYESGECPEEEVINDDDLLDGWCIDQKKKRKAEEKKRVADKYGNAGEIFIPVENAEQAARVNELNDSKARMIKNQKINLIAQKGTILEQDMPDAKLEIRMQAMQNMRNRGKN